MYSVPVHTRLYTSTCMNMNNGLWVKIIELRGYISLVSLGSINTRLISECQSRSRQLFFCFSLLLSLSLFSDLFNRTLFDFGRPQILFISTKYYRNLSINCADNVSEKIIQLQSFKPFQSNLWLEYLFSLRQVDLLSAEQCLSTDAYALRAHRILRVVWCSNRPFIHRFIHSLETHAYSLYQILISGELIAAKE